MLRKVCMALRGTKAEKQRERGGFKLYLRFKNKNKSVIWFSGRKTEAYSCRVLQTRCIWGIKSKLICKLF